jgi:hypothetical protein
LERLEQEIMTLIETWAARYVLALKSLEVLRSETGFRFKFVSTGDAEDISVGLEAATDFDLVDFLSHACEVHTEVHASFANLQRNTIINRVLDANGFGSLLLHLDPDAALKAGNAFTSVLTSRLGRQRVKAIMDGNAPLALGNPAQTKELLDELGLEMSQASGLPLRLEASAVRKEIKRKKKLMLDTRKE